MGYSGQRIRLAGIPRSHRAICATQGPADSIGRNLYVVGGACDDIASHRGTPIEPVWHQVYDWIEGFHVVPASDIMGCGGESNGGP